MRIFKLSFSRRMFLCYVLLILFDWIIWYECQLSMLEWLVLCVMQAHGFGCFGHKKVVSLQAIDGYNWFLRMSDDRQIKVKLSKVSRVFSCLMCLTFMDVNYQCYRCNLWRDSVSEHDWVVLNYYLKFHQYHRPYAGY